VFVNYGANRCISYLASFGERVLSGSDVRGSGERAINGIVHLPKFVEVPR